PTLLVTTPAGPKPFKQGVTAMMRGPLGGGAVHVRAPLVFVGYGMTDKTMGYDDYEGLDVRGKIAVVLQGSPKGMDSEIGAHLQSEQARFAADHGAAAVLEPKAAAALFDGAPKTLAQILEESDKPGGRPKGLILKSSAAMSVST